MSHYRLYRYTMGSIVVQVSLGTCYTKHSYPLHKKLIIIKKNKNKKAIKHMMTHFLAPLVVVP